MKFFRPYFNIQHNEQGHNILKYDENKIACLTYGMKRFDLVNNDISINLMIQYIIISN